ncbi:MAG TPA: hypothetical protein PKD55_01360 [Bellilinea sp.]|nr:hypothetical protein [Bellilinea sp.]
MEYLKATDDGAFLGMEKKDPQEYAEYRGSAVECPTCHGYGGWHLKLNAYGEGRHFDCSCSDCYGWGYLAEGERPYMEVFNEIKQDFQSKITLGLDGTYTVDESVLNDERLTSALIYAADSWWPFNFGGHVTQIGPNRFRVRVYTD